MASQTLRDHAARLLRLRQLQLATNDRQTLAAIDEVIAELEEMISRMEGKSPDIR
ncbi:hypothetical protein [Brevundimonas sp.]|uniref:hypothetical protein n=1 Tax=Brevundimonas sp. TaxID=1871086 RepID=UPI003BAAB7AC